MLRLYRAILCYCKITTWFFWYPFLILARCTISWDDQSWQRYYPPSRHHPCSELTNGALYWSYIFNVGRLMVNKTVVAIIPGCVSPKIVLTTAEIAQTDQTVIKLDQNEISCVILFNLPNINTYLCFFTKWKWWASYLIRCRRLI